MTKDLQVGIPTPCSENWNQMTPEANGRFCSSCQKTVLDFTVMDDQEILQWFESHHGSTCGRFKPDQLNRPMINRPEKKSRWRYWHYLIAGLLFSSEVSAQTKPAAPPMTQQIPTNPDTPILLGKIKAVHERKPSTDSIRGRVVDTSGNAVPGARIMYKKALNVASDDNGYFSIPASKVPGHATLHIIAIGYKSVEINVDQLSTASPIRMTPEMSSADVIVGFTFVSPANRSSSFNG